MRAVVNRSKRVLTEKELVVDWRGHGDLFYRMNKGQMREAFRVGRALAQQHLTPGIPTLTSFKLILNPTGSMEIGCEKFNRDEVRELKRWMKEGKNV